jgi:hypothetical protein
MQTVHEIPQEPYADVVRMLLAAGAALPEVAEGHDARTLIAGLGIEPPR